MYKEYQTKHYIFHYQENSLAEKDIEQIVLLQENCFSHISDVLQVTFKEKIHYWLCDTTKEVGRIYGDNEPCCGFCKEPDTIYAVYNDRMKCIGPHEDAHLISYQINTPKSVFLREGLAMYFDQSWWSVANRKWSTYFKKKKMDKSIKELFLDSVFYDVECSISYPIAGAFTEYLILKYGMKKYIQFYKYSGMDFDAYATQVFEKTLEELDTDFWQYIEVDLLDTESEKEMDELRTAKLRIFSE